MAGKGNTIPKPAAQRRRTNKSTTARKVASTAAHGPELPAGFDWPAQTRNWWETWRRCAQAETFTATDWDFLLDTALLHGAMWSGNSSVAAEIRLRVSKMGATPEDRARLHIDIDEPDLEVAATRTKASASRRARLKVV